MGKKKNKQSGGGKQSKKSEREMRTFHRRKRDRITYGGEKWNADFKKLSAQLSTLGLTIKDVAGDGNCMFRAIADQMENNPNKHHECRATIVTFIEKNRDMFEPFLDAEHDGSFEEYVLSMRTDGTWGGNLEIQAASLSLHINIIIYQLDQPRWEVVNFAEIKTKTIQLSYLDGDHYASVRAVEGIPVPSPHVTTIPTHIAAHAPKKEVDTYVEPPNDFEKLVMDGSGNHDIKLVRSALDEHQWDPDATIAFLLQIQASAEATGADVLEDKEALSPVEDTGHHHRHLSKIAEHIHHPHIPHPHLHHHKQQGGGGGGGGKKKKKKGGGGREEPVPPPAAPIKEMGALSI